MLFFTEFGIYALFLMWCTCEFTRAHAERQTLSHEFQRHRVSHKLHPSVLLWHRHYNSLSPPHLLTQATGGESGGQKETGTHNFLKLRRISIAIIIRCSEATHLPKYHSYPFKMLMLQKVSWFLLCLRQQFIILIIVNCQDFPHPHRIVQNMTQKSTARFNDCLSSQPSMGWY